MREVKTRHPKQCYGHHDAVTDLNHSDSSHLICSSSGPYAVRIGVLWDRLKSFLGIQENKLSEGKLEETEDVFLEKLMDEYAEAEGRRFIDLNEQLQRTSFIDVPTKVEKRFHELIEEKLNKS